LRRPRESVCEREKVVDTSGWPAGNWPS
jgi:hypothetical protein